MEESIDYIVITICKNKKDIAQTKLTQTTIFKSLVLIFTFGTSFWGYKLLGILIYPLCNPWLQFGVSKVLQKHCTLGLKIQPLQNQLFFHKFSYYLSWDLSQSLQCANSKLCLNSILFLLIYKGCYHYITIYTNIYSSFHLIAI